MVSGDDVAKYVVYFNLDVAVYQQWYVYGLPIGITMYEAISRCLWNSHRHVRSLDEWTAWVEENIAEFDIKLHRAQFNLPVDVEGDRDE